MQHPPRVPLGIYPTPLVHAARLSEKLGIELYFKEEANSWFALGGNKIRAIEYLVGDHRDWDVCVLAGGPRSNFIRAAAAACRRLNKIPVCAFYGQAPIGAGGNQTLLAKLGVEIHFSGSDDRASSEELGTRLKNAFEAAGQKVKFVRRGGAQPESVFGFYQMQSELESQLKTISPVDHLVVPLGSGTTLAGLLIDGTRLNSVGKIWGICCSRDLAESERNCRSLAAECAARFGLPSELKGNVAWNGDYLGEGYGEESYEMAQSMELAARLEGIFLDPIFNAKAFWGLTDLIQKGQITKGQRVVFLNGGGSPELFRN